MNQEHQPPRVAAPMGAAWQGMQDILFRPFHLNVWIGLGFTAWLAHMGESGLQLDVPMESSDLQGPPEVLGALVSEYRWLMVTLLSLGLILVVALSILFTWLRCRGAFMFLENAVRRHYRVVERWHAARQPGYALFRWVLGYAAVAVLALVLVLTPAGVLAYQHGHGLDPWPWPVVVGCTLPLALLWIVSVGLINLALRDFIVPIMAVRRLSTHGAWCALGGLVSAQPLPFLGYLLARGGLSMLAGLLIVLGGCLTCCCLFVILMVPVVWAVVLLPWLLFIRLYSVEFLRQFGPDYDVGRLVQPPPPPPDVPAEPSGPQGSSEPTS